MLFILALCYYVYVLQHHISIFFFYGVFTSYIIITTRSSHLAVIYHFTFIVLPIYPLLFSNSFHVTLWPKCPCSLMSLYLVRFYLWVWKFHLFSNTRSTYFWFLSHREKLFFSFLNSKFAAPFSYYIQVKI